MARLPQPGGDSGQWGAILNDYLSQSHDDEGSLKTGSVGATQLRQSSVTSFSLADGSVSTPKLADNAVTPAKLDALGTAHGIASLDEDAKLPESQLPDRLGVSNLDTTINTAINAALGNAGSGATGIRLDALAAGQRLRAVTAGNRSVTASGVTIGTLTPVATISTVTAASLGVATITAVDDLVTLPSAHGLKINDVIVFGTLTDAAGLTAGQVFYVQAVPSSTTFKVSSSFGGTVRNITSDGSAVAVYRREFAYLRGEGYINPALQVVSTRPVQAATTTPQWDYIGPDPTIITVGTGVASGTYLDTSFRYDGAAIDLLLRNTGGDKQIYIDGLYLTTITNAAITAAGAASGTNARLPLVFSSAGIRIIRVFEMSSSARFVGMDVPAGQRIMYPAGRAKGPRVLVVGDSFTEGTGATGGYPWVVWTSWHMGWIDVWKAGAGSTGYVADGTRLALIDRYTNDIIAQAPDICIIAMGLNDRVNYETDPTATLSSIETIWDAVLTALPAMQLIIIGPWPTSGGVNPASGIVNLDADLSRLAAERALRYISPVSEGWTFSLSDDTHPDAAGHELLGWRVAGHLDVPYIAPNS